MSSSKIVMKIVSILVTILIMVIIALSMVKMGNYAYEFGYRIFAEKPLTDESTAQESKVQITEGMSAKEIGNLLQEKGLIDSSVLFAVQLRISDYHNTIKPGLYTLSTAETPEEMMAIMSSTNANEEKEQE